MNQPPRPPANAAKEPPRSPASASDARRAMQLLAAMNRGVALKPGKLELLRGLLGRLPESGREARLWKIFLKKRWKQLAELEGSEHSLEGEGDD